MYFLPPWLQYPVTRRFRPIEGAPEEAPEAPEDEAEAPEAAGWPRRDVWLAGAGAPEAAEAAGPPLGSCAAAWAPEGCAGRDMVALDAGEVVLSDDCALSSVSSLGDSRRCRFFLVGPCPAGDATLAPTRTRRVRPDYTISLNPGVTSNLRDPVTGEVKLFFLFASISLFFP